MAGSEAGFAKVGCTKGGSAAAEPSQAGAPAPRAATRLPTATTTATVAARQPRFAPCHADGDCGGSPGFRFACVARGAGHTCEQLELGACAAGDEAKVGVASDGRSVRYCARASERPSNKPECSCGPGQVLFSDPSTVICVDLPCTRPGGSCKKPDGTTGSCTESGTGESGQRVRCGHLVECE